MEISSGLLQLETLLPVDEMVSCMSKGVQSARRISNQQRDDLHLKKTRKAIADLVGAKPNEAVFGPNSTSIMFSVERT
ncbi:hypothetical protein ACT8ZR_24800 [Neobacillus sp. M.A.Huq-85]